MPVMGQKFRMLPTIKSHCPGQRAPQAEPREEGTKGEGTEKSGPGNRTEQREDLPSTEMSWMAKRRMMVQIMPRVIFRFPSTISAG